jgi:lactate dehydrogenase-like 2-hydroxyacid dehydrogenase
LHLPLNPSTYHLFDRSTLAKMKPGAYLINTSRGALVDETALVEALRDGRLAGAGLDTFEQIDVHGQVAEAPAHPLLSLSNVVLTPHVAAGSVEAHREVMVDGVANLATVLRGEWPPPESIVNPMVCPRFPLHN